MQKSISRKIYIFGLILMLFSGTIYGVSGISSYEPIFLALSLVLMCLSSRTLYISNRFKNHIQSIFLVFIVFIAVSFIFHPEFSIVITVIGLILLAFTLTVQIPRIKDKNAENYENDINVILIYLLIVQLYSVLQGFTTHRFTGLYSNANFTGGEAAALCAVANAAFLQNLYRNDSRSRNILPIVSIVVSTIIGVATNSRTAVGAIIIMLLLTAFFVMRRGKERKFFFRVMLFVCMSIVAVLVLYRIDFIHSAVNELVVKQVTRQGNELSGRLDRWDIVFSRLTFFGNGEASSFGTHSTYFSMLDQYGFIPFGLFTLFVVVGSISSFKLAISKEYSDMKFFPLFCFVCFGVSSLFEQMLLKSIMLLCLYSVPIITIFHHKNTVNAKQEII